MVLPIEKRNQQTESHRLLKVLPLTDLFELNIFVRAKEYVCLLVLTELV